MSIFFWGEILAGICGRWYSEGVVHWNRALQTPCHGIRVANADEVQACYCNVIVALEGC